MIFFAYLLQVPTSSPWAFFISNSSFLFYILSDANSMFVTSSWILIYEISFLKFKLFLLFYNCSFQIFLLSNDIIYERFLLWFVVSFIYCCFLNFTKILVICLPYNSWAKFHFTGFVLALRPFFFLQALHTEIHSFIFTWNCILLPFGRDMVEQDGF